LEVIAMVKFKSMFVLAGLMLVGVSGCPGVLPSGTPVPGASSCAQLDEWSFVDEGVVYTMTTTQYASGVLGLAGIGTPSPDGFVFFAGLSLRAENVRIVIGPEEVRVLQQATGMDILCEAVLANRGLLFAFHEELSELREELDELRALIHELIGDDDGDGVPNWKDECPNTPEGVEVDDVGCPIEPPHVVGPFTLTGNAEVAPGGFGNFCIQGLPSDRSGIGVVWISVRESDGAEIEAVASTRQMDDDPFCKDFALTGSPGDGWATRATISIGGEEFVTNEVTTTLK
jgi:hypothetical protein